MSFFRRLIPASRYCGGQSHPEIDYYHCDGMGWDRLVGTGVATALKIVQWPTPFLTRHSASSVGRGYSNEQSPPRSRAYRRVHTDRSDPTILQYSDIRRYSNLTASQAKTWCQRKKVGRHAPKTSLRQSGVWENQGCHKSFTASECLSRENRVQRQVK